MRARDSMVLERCVEVGVKLGLNRARKHKEAPTEDEIVEAILRAVMHEAGEWFIFEEDRA